MNERLFAEHLKNVLATKTKEYENNILSGNFNDIASVKRLIGIREAFVQIKDAIIDEAIESFYKDHI